jgi:hypothetical protein
MPRTGSSYLTQLLKCCPEFNVHAELFHKNSVGLKPGERSALLKAAGGEATDEQSLNVWRRRNPGKVLDALLHSSGERPLFFKLFGGHLSKAQVAAEILSRDDVRYVLLWRRPIESFISSRKASHYGVHGRVDTTTLKPTIVDQDFVNWALRYNRWYDWTARELRARGLPTMEIVYETQLKNAESHVALAGILDGLVALGLPKVALPEELLSSERQDREPDYRARVANWAEFEREILSVPAHAELLQWAETVPGLPSPSAASKSASTGQGRPGNGAGKPSTQADSREERRRLKRERRRAQKKGTRIAGKRGRDRAAQ